MIFRRAKVRLALSFAVVQLTLFAVFGAGIYVYVTHAFDFDAAESDGSDVSAEAAFGTLRDGLLLGYLLLVVVIPVISYVLASLALRPVRAAYEAQQRFVDDASHELRTPLSAIQAQLELSVSRPRTAAQQLEFINRALDATGRLGSVLTDLLVLSRGQADAHLTMTPVAVAEMVNDAVAQLPPEGAARVRINAPADVIAELSESLLARAVLNLLTNALRYSPESSTVSVVVERRGRDARISVSDEGIGMTSAQQALAFERFWRADPSRSSDGRGLGLAIAQEIVVAHAGRLSLSSTPGIGTVAIIDLPLSRSSHDRSRSVEIKSGRGSQNRKRKS